MIYDSFDEKLDYETRCSHKHNKNRNSYETITPSHHSHSDSEDEKAAPLPCTSVLYNTIDEKPLPPVPQTRCVRFALQKPLPPLPQESQQLKRKRASSRDGEYAWWVQSKYKLAEEALDAIAREKSPWKE